MTSDLVLKLFGAPTDISQAVCGATGSMWNCTTWKYGDFPYESASFTFASDNKPFTLNNFDIDRGGESLPASFTTENILKVHQGMRSEKILKIFGLPKSVSQTVCGAKTDSTWNCTTWKYGDFPYASASFTFSGEHGSLILNNFKVDKE